MPKDSKPVHAELFDAATPTLEDSELSIDAIATRMISSGIAGVEIVPVRHAIQESALIHVRNAVLHPESYTLGLQALAWQGEPYRVHRGMHAGQVTYSVNRETVHYGQQYMYTDVAKPALPWAPSGPIPILRSLVAQLIGVPLERVDQCSCNRNAAGKGMGLHPGKRNPLVVGSFSFLGVRRMGFCDIGGDHFDDHLPAVVLEPGSLLIFTENFNEKFKHGIRDQAGTGQRISVIFRIFARQS